MKQRCPHCQTTPLRIDAETCWYCGKAYVLRQTRPVRVAPRAVLARRRGESKAVPARPG